MLKKFILIILFTLISNNYPNSFSKQRNNFIHRKGQKLYLKGKTIKLKGICFGNNVWENIETPVTHHNKKDYQRIKSWEVNVVRFYMNYKTFENDNKPFQYKKSGWDWIDKNVKWAKKHNIYLILNMHVPQGGFQSLAQGSALWEQKENQERLIALWEAIAQRYRHEPTIAAYDLVNEPVTTQSVDQWKNLSQKIINTIRTVDKNHLIIVEKLLGVKGKWHTYADNNYTQFLVNDSNVMYQFHFYLPFEYTHQNAPWTTFGDGGKYPDKKIIQVPEDAVWQETSGYNKKVSAGTSDWKYYIGKIYKANVKPGTVCFPVLVSRNNSGTVYFDSFTIKEYNKTKKYIRKIMDVDIKDAAGWYSWSANKKGIFSYSTVSGHNDLYSLTISGTSDDANYTGKKYPFKPKPGYYYQINGRIKGNDINSDADCYMRIDYYLSKTNSPIYRRDKKYLEAKLKDLIAFGKKHRVPMYCGEFGINKECFKQKKGGLIWIKDMLTLFDKYKIHFTYHAYHEEWFGIFANNKKELPDLKTLRTDVVNLFKSKLK